MSDAKKNVELHTGSRRMSAPWKIMIVEATRLFRAVDYFDLAFDPDVEALSMDELLEGEITCRK